ncbi:unnamed protein product [Ranitomeya imitator]|uniref:Uncharacterized protein n=1 Tax=Ranitomeya imitator TaxID=111125 RepID=A0ABN9LLM0_9NEOB|nr:unnamed protein product [Ranitomeya imitator]
MKQLTSSPEHLREEAQKLQYHFILQAKLACIMLKFSKRSVASLGKLTDRLHLIRGFKDNYYSNLQQNRRVYGFAAELHARNAADREGEECVGGVWMETAEKMCVSMFGLRPHTLPHEAASPHITTRGFVLTHYHMRLHLHTLPHEAPSPHITTRCSNLTHYHTRLRLHTLPHEAPSSHITTRGSVLTHYHTRLRLHTLPHEALSPHITI